MESIVQNDVEEAQQFLVDSLPEKSVIEYDNQPLVTAAEKVYAIAEDKNHPLHRPVSHAVSIIEEALTKYGAEKLAICFNGGKDCTALLHLFYAVVLKKEPQNRRGLKALCISIDDPFPEMEVFIKESSQRYGLQLWTYHGSVKLGLRSALAEHPEIQAVLMGTRRTDPSGEGLAYFQMTDPSWPQVMRVSPMLEWSYTDLWQFLRTLTLPYCSLYDRGYTSIGSRSNTLPNPGLLIQDKTQVRYRPAYQLENSAAERTGRQ